MEKQTLSNYGLLTVVTLILAVMLAFATPFGTYVGDGVVNVANSFVGASNKSMDKDNIDNLSNRFEEKLYEGQVQLHPGAVYKNADGKEIKNGALYTLQTGDTYEYGDYIYKYNYYYKNNKWYSDESQNGWGVRVKDTSKTTYGDILSEIVKKPVTNMNYTFYVCRSLTTSPVIPNSVTNMCGTFKCCDSLTTPPTIPSSVTNMEATFEYSIILTDLYDFVIPSSVTNMNNTFYSCGSLTTAPVIPNSVTNMYNTFQNCTSLTGTITINANPLVYNTCFAGTRKPITLTGSSTKLSDLADTAYNGNVTVG